MKALIIGIRSFTGQYVLEELRSAGYSVFGTIQAGDCEAHERIADITQTDKLINVLEEIQPDYIIHLAAISFIPTANVELIYQVNLLGTLNLIKAIQNVGLLPKKILIPSTANVYGDPESLPVNESSQLKPVSHYANSKIAMENALQLYFDDYPIIITRPFNYTGVGQTANFLIPKIIRHYRENLPEIDLGNLDVTRDFSSVRFVASAYRLLLESDAHSDVINICSGTQTSLSKIINILDELSGYHIKINSISEFKRKNEITHLVGSTQKLENVIGKIAQPSIQEILTEMYHAKTRC